jgi:hypothetical protein
VLRLGRTILPLVLGAALLAGWGPPRAAAQSTGDFDSLLLRPEIDGDPGNPPRFRRADDRNTAVPNRATALPTYGHAPGFGAGPTGFDSTNARRKNQRSQNAKATSLIPSAANASAASRRGTSTTSSVATPGSTATATAMVVPGTPAALQPPTTPSVAAATGSVRLQRLQARGAVPLSDPADPTVVSAALDASSARRRALQETNPFDPTGIQVGAFLLRPAIEVSGGYDTNPDRTSAGRPSWYYVVTPELRVNSNWAVHELTANLRGSYNGYEPASSLNRPNIDGKVNGRIDVREGTRIDLEGRLFVGTDSPGSPNIQAGLAHLPIYTTVGATAGIGQRFNRFEIASRGLVDRTVYQSSTFTDGSVESNDDRNYNRYANETRLSYELTPGVRPFVEAGADSRVHDLTPDNFGFDRDSTGYYAKGGTTFELSRILTGDIAVGWLSRSYKDPSLPDIGGVTFDSSLAWLATALTTVKLVARTSVTESTVPGVAGAFTREATAEINHAFRRWLVATLRLTAATDDYVGSPRLDHRFAASTGIIYKLTREIQLKGEYRHEWLRSNSPGNDYDADVFLVGARLQR